MSEKDVDPIRVTIVPAVPTTGGVWIDCDPATMIQMKPLALMEADGALLALRNKMAADIAAALGGRRP